MDRIDLIKLITSHHPGQHTESGYSYYTGGMKDSGDWYYQKLFNLTEYELQVLLKECVARENGINEASKADKNDPRTEEEKWKEYWKYYERKMWFGE